MTEKSKKEKMVSVPVSITRDSSGKTVCQYKEVPLRAYEAWLKQCYELSGN